MKLLKDILREGVLSDPEHVLNEIDIVANKATREKVKAYIKSKISGNSGALIATDEIFELIPECCLKRPDTEKKGSMFAKQYRYAANPFTYCISPLGNFNIRSNI